MDVMHNSLLEFLILSQCRMREHYLLKLQACLAVLGKNHLWQPTAETTDRTIGGLILHILEHPRRHAVWIRTRSKPCNEPRFEDYFPSAGVSSVQMRNLVDDQFNAWLSAMASLTDEVRANGTLPEDVPNMGAIYHLVEHVSYHLGQVIIATEGVTGHKFGFCQRGINEQVVSHAANAMLMKAGE